jgi:hypothetical protein
MFELLVADAGNAAQLSERGSPKAAMSGTTRIYSRKLPGVFEHDRVNNRANAIASDAIAIEPAPLFLASFM